PLATLLGPESSDAILRQCFATALASSPGKSRDRCFATALASSPCTSQDRSAVAALTSRAPPSANLVRRRSCSEPLGRSRADRDKAPDQVKARELTQASLTILLLAASSSIGAL